MEKEDERISIDFVKICRAIVTHYRGLDIKNKMVVKWGVAMVLFLTTAVTAIEAAMQPAMIKQFDYLVAPSALTLQGLALRADAWKAYPTYNIGLAFIAVVSFIGALYSISVMYSIKGRDNEKMAD